jgi:hypothetical protein
MTIWELFDKFQKKLPNEQVTYENLRKLLLGMQKQHKAGIVNYKQEVKRQKLQRNSYYNRYNRRTEREYRHPLNYGQPLRGLAGLTVHVVEVWTAENNA